MKELQWTQKNYVVDGFKWGKPKKRWKEVIEKGMQTRGLERSDAQDRAVRKLDCKNFICKLQIGPEINSKFLLKLGPNLKTRLNFQLWS